MSSTAEARSAQLLDEGARLLASLWDDDLAMVRTPEAPDFHTPRGTLAYARVLLRAGDAARAERALRAVLALQETRPHDAHYGNFRWQLEEPVVRDLNGVEFMLDGLIELIREHAASLSPGCVEATCAAIALGLAEIARLDVHPSYTNIALSDIANSILGGELLGDEGAVSRGARRLDEWLAFTVASGAPHEFNSPTYAAVDILRLAAIAEHTADPRIARAARVAEERMWLHVAAHYHPRLAQLAGPHSRAYFDGWSGAGGFLKLLLWRLLGDDALRRETPYAPRSREEGHIDVATASLHCPDYVQRWLGARRYPFETRETASARLGLDIATFMTPAYALGTASRAFRVGKPPELWPGFNSVHLYATRPSLPGYCALYARYIVNDKVPGTGHEREDLWEEGQHAGVQLRNRTIMAYAPLSRVAPARSYKLSIRLLGVSDDDAIRVGDRRVDAWPARVEAEQRIVLPFGDTYLALVPLLPTDMGSDAPIELNRDGETLTLDIYNYRGAAKTFWEYRSQSGPFFKGNVRNGFVLEVADLRDYESIDAFASHVAAGVIADATDGDLRRTIDYGCGCGSVGLTFSLRDMRIIERRHDGAPYAPPAAEAGACDGTGPQFLQTAGAGAHRLGRARLEHAGAALWLIADDTARRYLVVNPGGTTRLRLATPDVAVACDALPTGRIDLDEASGVVRIDADVAPSDLRIEPASLRLIINGVESSRAS